MKFTKTKLEMVKNNFLCSARLIKIKKTVTSFINHNKSKYFRVCATRLNLVS